MKSLYKSLRSDNVEKHYLPLLGNLGNNNYSIEYYFIEKTTDLDGVASIRFLLRQVLHDKEAP